MANRQSTLPLPGRVPALYGHLRKQEALLVRAYRLFARVSPKQAPLSYAAEWLMDNFQLVQQALRQIRQDMPEQYYRHLPRLDTGSTRVYPLAQEIMLQCGSPLDGERVTHFVQAYQEVIPLTMGELWALPTMLRLGSLECLSAATLRLMQVGEEVAEAEPDGEVHGADWADAATVANSILNLRWLATQDWTAFFEGVSQVEKVLGTDPAGVYREMDTETRDRYRKVVEELARGTGREERAVAQEAILLAERAHRGDHSLQRTKHVGFYLLDAGRAELERLLGYRAPLTIRLRRWALAHPTLTYLGTILLLSLVLLFPVVGYAALQNGNLTQQLGGALLASMPIVAAAVYLANWLVTHSFPPRLLPRMDFRSGIPDSCRTVVVIPAILSTARECNFLLRQLELHYLGNADLHLQFALLTDFADAPHEQMPEDEAILAELRSGVESLNNRYGQVSSGPFCLFHRPRRWNPVEECWMGWERKRGKLAEFDKLILGSKETSYQVQLGDLSRLRDTRFVITLDSDTILPRDSAQRLIATLAHPLNEPEIDPASGRLVAGCTVLQPRLEISPTSASRSAFSRIFAGGEMGLDPYTRAMSDVYQDLFGEGNYAGKGIYDVAAFETSLAGRVPENALLSHDLFEGIHGRACLVTDVALLEDFPSSYLAHARRLHRWVRGDWQLLPWLMPKVPSASGGKILNDLSVLDRWKILDNLRRSLVPLGLLGLLAAGWLWFPGSPAVWTGVALLTTAVPLLGDLGGVVLGFRRQAGGNGLGRLWIDGKRWLLSLAFLPYEVLILLDAIGATLVRLTRSHRHLLRWTPSAHTLRLLGRQLKLGIVWKQMAGAPVLSFALAALIVWINPRALLAAAPLLLAWLVSPQIAHRVSRPRARTPARLSPDQEGILRRLARRTWLYFERFVGPEDHWLAPDHFQEEPRGLIAHRTSPTNLGLMLLSTLAAYDQGYIDLTGLELRLGDALGSMRALESYHGHLLNWYDTRSLQPLSPRYVSTVDSGNLAACLLALRQGCKTLPRTPKFGLQRWQGLLDTLAVLAELLQGDTGERADEAFGSLRRHLEDLRVRILQEREDPEAWVPLLDHLSGEGWQRLETLLTELVEREPRALELRTLRSLQTWAACVRRHLDSMLREFALLLPWLAVLRQPPRLLVQPGGDPGLQEMWQAIRRELRTIPSLAQVIETCRAAQGRLERLRDCLVDEIGSADEVREARAWCETHIGRLADTRLTARTLMIGLEELGEEAEGLFRRMDFGFLYDAQRQLFHVGYNVDSRRLDESYYDLLASEARIASLVAIAKGDVAQSHWLHLARPVARMDGSRGLLSWNGSMFEYLMPGLLVRNYEGALLEHTCRLAVDRQIAYGREKGVPWGISESGYYRFDAQRNYQYRGFGVPGLGLKRGLAGDLVIAPYASLLALSLEPQAAVQNLTWLVSKGMLGLHGLYEAIDYTPSRLLSGERAAIVFSYMAHHQAMILVALTNYLLPSVMVDRFHGDLRVQSVELLLQEMVPRQAPLEVPQPEAADVFLRPGPPVRPRAWRVPVDAPQPQVHVLSNGRYHLMVTSAGGGYSRWQDLDLTRWRADTTLDDWGTWIYVQDRETGVLWSATRQPVCSPTGIHQALFAAHQAEFVCRQQGISLRTEVTVAPEDDVEIRRLTLTNDEAIPRRLRLTSYGEVVLASHVADRRHPAFAKLFVESEWLPELNALLFHKRPSALEGAPVYLLHALVLARGIEGAVAYESDRAHFLGRGRTPRAPAAFDRMSAWLSDTSGATLDPIMALGVDVDLEPYATLRLTYLTMAGTSRHEVLELAGRYRYASTIDRAFEGARTHTGLQLRQLGLESSGLQLTERLLSSLLYPHAALRASPATLSANNKGQAGLWGFGISGDDPILLIRISAQEETGIVRELLRAHEFWRSKGVRVDLVILNLQDSGYEQELQGHLHRLVAEAGADAWLNQRGGVFVLRADTMNKADRTLLETAARVVLDGSRGPLSEQLAAPDPSVARPPAFVPALPGTGEVEPTPPLPRPEGLLFDNGIGGFSSDGREYIVHLGPGRLTPKPWINVIAYPRFGFMVSEAGSGNTWAGNSAENRLTPWSNDPVCDTPGEVLYLRDEETGQFWSPTPLPAPAQEPYLVRHGAGYSAFEHHSHGLIQRLRLFAVPEAPVKVIHLRVTNAWSRIRRITATFHAEWLLGTSREETRAFIVTEHHAKGQALLARNAYSPGFGKAVAFVAASHDLHGLTADRCEFLGRMGTRARPAALERTGLAGVVGAGRDPSAVLQLHLELNPGQSKEVFFLLGQGADREEALGLIDTYRDAGRVDAAWLAVANFWDGLLRAVTVRTPDLAMDLALNQWLLYQTLSCRVWGRSALYQSAGGYGYRDQLQDIMALSHCAPEVAREHILRAARHQFEEGDVLHWWHPPSIRGVRTRCSDDLLWLPYVTAHYVTLTGDESIMHEHLPFLRGPALTSDENEHYDVYDAGPEAGTLYEHCCRALDKGSTAGAHGLPLIGAGDWNDGLNRVGLKGRGESIWLGWFLHAALTAFAPWCQHQGEEERASEYLQRAEGIRQALEAHGWDGRWYRRAYDDDGRPLGSAENRECQIDSIAQSWAVLSGAGEPERAAQAVQLVLDRLVQPDERLVLLLAPPFDTSAVDPGYIMGYPPGVRENGGQYTHAAVWAAWALAAIGRGDQAEQLFRILNPIYHGDTARRITIYQVEPYVIAADICGAPPHIGRGGWTWYTGSSAWMYRLGLEAILGVRREGHDLIPDPCIPSAWPGYDVTLRCGRSVYQIHVENPDRVNRGVRQVMFDGTPSAGGHIPLRDDGRRHEVHVLMGPRPPGSARPGSRG